MESGCIASVRQTLQSVHVRWQTDGKNGITGCNVAEGKVLTGGVVLCKQCWLTSYKPQINQASLSAVQYYGPLSSYQAAHCTHGKLFPYITLTDATLL